MYSTCSPFSCMLVTPPTQQLPISSFSMLSLTVLTPPPPHILVGGGGGAPLLSQLARVSTPNHTAALPANILTPYYIYTHHRPSWPLPPPHISGGWGRGTSSEPVIISSTDCFFSRQYLHSLLCLYSMLLLYICNMYANLVLLYSFVC